MDSRMRAPGIQRRTLQPRHLQGLTFLFTSLSGTGNSTPANASNRALHVSMRPGSLDALEQPLYEHVVDGCDALVHHGDGFATTMQAPA